MGSTVAPLSPPLAATEAIRLFRQVIDAGHTAALNNLAVLLAEAGDIAEAIRLLQRAIDAGHTEATENLATLKAVVKHADGAE